MKMIESCDITQVISTYPLKKKTLINLLNSQHIMPFLKCISDNSDSITKLILQKQEMAPWFNLTNINSAIEARIEGNVDESAKREDYDDDFEEIGKLHLSPNP